MLTFSAALVQARRNWKSGLTVALVSIPLSVSLAVASQATPTVGIITAIWAGIIAAIFGGSHYNVVGPTGALSGLLAAQALTNGPACLPMLAILSGAFILCAYYFRLERYLIFIPASVLHGFIIGVAAIIILNQFDFAFGIPAHARHEHLMGNLWESLQLIGSSSGAALAIFGLFLAALFAIARFLPSLPPVIAVTPFGILLGYAASTGVLPWLVQTLGDKFTDIQPRLFLFPSFSFSLSYMIPALAIAVVALLETMLSAKVADVMTQTKHNASREVFGLGLANLVTGLCGGIPATAALARTSLNIKSGCTNRMSAVLSSLGVVAISFLLLSTFRFIPLAVISSILVFVAVRMVEAEHIIAMFRLDKRSFWVAVLVAVVTVYEDPIVGILLGAVIAMILFMDKLSQGAYEILSPEAITQAGGREPSPEREPDVLIYAIKGPLAYINGQSHVTFFEEKLTPYRAVILKLNDLSYIDLDGAQALSEMIDLAQRQQKPIFVVGIREPFVTMVHESKKIEELQDKGVVLKTAAQALVALKAIKAA